MASESKVSKLLGYAAPVDEDGASLIRMKETDVTSPSMKKIGVKCVRTTVLLNTKGGPDDAIYAHYPETVRKVPRCYSIFILSRDGVPDTKIVMHGMYKFGARNTQDEDDGILTVAFLTPENMSRAKYALITRKDNGKAGIVSAFRYCDLVFIVGGSKTQHFCVCMSSIDEDMAAVKKACGSITLSYDILAAFINQLKKTRQDELFDFLCSGYSLCGEFNDGMHMIPLEKGVDKHINWFGIVKNVGEISEGSAICYNHDETVAMLTGFGLPLVPSEKLTIEEFDAKKASLRWKPDDEGSVIHWLTSEMETVGMEKYKTWWYVLIRVVREFMKSRQFNQNWKSNLAQKLLTRNTDYMKLPDGVLFLWFELFVKFISWFLEKKYQPAVLGFVGTGRGMGNVWSEFRTESKENDDFSDYAEILIRRNLGDFSFAEFLKTIPVCGNLPLYGCKPANGVLLIVQGFPGLGKNTVGDAVVQKLSYTGAGAGASAAGSASGNIRAFDQDSFYATHGKKGSGKACIAACKSAMSDNVKVIMLLRNNSNRRQYQNYISLAQEMGYSITVISPNMKKPSILGMVCLQSVLKRTGHATFSGNDATTNLKLVMAFIASLRVPEVSDEIHQVITIDWLKDEIPDGIVDHVATSYFYQYLNDVKKNAIPFNATARPADEAIAAMKLDSVDYSIARKPLDVMINDVQTLCTKLIKDVTEKKIFVASDDDGESKSEKDAIYYGMFIGKKDKKAKKSLKQALNKFKVNMKAFSTFALDHITFVHCSLFADNSGVVEKLKTLQKKTGTFVVHGVLVIPDKIVVYLVRDMKLDDGTSLGEMVVSGVPHVTGMMAKGIKPQESINVVKKFNADGEASGIVKYDIGPFTVKGTVGAFYGR